MKPNEVNKYGWIVLIIGIIIGAIGTMTHKALLMTGIVLMVASTIFRLIKFRCPYCGTYLDRGNPEYCPQCGKKVNE